MGMRSFLRNVHDWPQTQKGRAYLFPWFGARAMEIYFAETGAWVKLNQGCGWNKLRPGGLRRWDGGTIEDVDMQDDGIPARRVQVMYFWKERWGNLANEWAVSKRAGLREASACYAPRGAER